MGIDVTKLFTFVKDSIKQEDRNRSSSTKGRICESSLKYRYALIDDEDTANRIMDWLLDNGMQNVYGNKVQGQYEVHFASDDPQVMANAVSYLKSKGIRLTGAQKESVSEEIAGKKILMPIDQEVFAFDFLGNDEMLLRHVQNDLDTMELNKENVPREGTKLYVDGDTTFKGNNVTVASLWTGQAPSNRQHVLIYPKSQKSKWESKLEETKVGDSVYIGGYENPNTEEAKETISQCSACGEIVENTNRCSCGCEELNQIYPIPEGKEIIKEEEEEKSGSYTVKDREGNVYATNLTFKQAHDFVQDAKTQVRQKGGFIITSESIKEGRGEGRGVGGPRQGDGGVDVCKCSNCGTILPKQKGTPCKEKYIVCPNCGEENTICGINVKEAYDTMTPSTNTVGTEKDVRKVIAKGITDKQDAENVARSKRGKVVSDEDDPKKFMVVVEESKLNEERQTFLSDVKVSLFLSDFSYDIETENDYDLLTRRIGLNYGLDIEYRSWGIKGITPIFDSGLTISWSDNAGQHDIDVTADMLRTADIWWEEGGFYGPTAIDVMADTKGVVSNVQIWFTYIKP